MFVVRIHNAELTDIPEVKLARAVTFGKITLLILVTIPVLPAQLAPLQQYHNKKLFAEQIKLVPGELAQLIQFLL